MDLHRLLEDVVAELDREEELGRQAARATTERAARRFLEGLDPGSQEGLWFEAVAERFPSRLDAAIAYVRDVKHAR